MQLLNKEYIIKAAHSTCSTIAVLGRGAQGRVLTGTIENLQRKANMSENGRLQ